MFTSHRENALKGNIHGNNLHKKEAISYKEMLETVIL